MKIRTCKKRGFTLLETMVVVSVIGMLASLSMPYWAKAVSSAQLQNCLSNQRNIYDAVVLYEIETGKSLSGIKSNADSIRKRLMNNGYISKIEYFECPASAYLDYADYNLLYSKKNFDGTTCLNYPTEHLVQVQ